MEEYEKLKRTIKEKEKELGELRFQLQCICPHPVVGSTEYDDDDWAVNKTHVRVYTCQVCGLSGIAETPS